MSDARRARVLAIDDDVLLVRSMLRGLKGHHDAWGAHGFDEAIAMIAEHPGLDLILCDVHLPDRPGERLADVVARRWPGLERKVVYMTGGAQSEEDRAFLEMPGVRWISKPFSLAELRELARRSLENGAT